MSDLADDSEGVSALGMRGARFISAKQSLGFNRNAECACGGRPTFSPDSPGKEVLRCPKCGRSAGPLASRQRLIAEWNGRVL